MNNFYGFNKFEKKIIELINKTRFSKTDKRFSDMLNRIIKKYLRNVTLIINKDSINFSIYENNLLKIANYFNFWGLKTKIKTKLISLQKEKVYTLLKLIVYLFENKLIESINIKESKNDNLNQCCYSVP